MQTREKTIPQNLNGKLACSCFCHIDVAGPGIPESLLPEIMFVFKTKDNSHPPVKAHIIDSCRQPLQEISESFTLLSHGLTRTEFIQKMLTNVKDSNMSTPMVTYFYKKITD